MSATATLEMRLDQESPSIEERTFVMVKPHAFEYAEEILDMIDEVGTSIVDGAVHFVPLDVIQEHYRVHDGKPFFRQMTRHLAGNSVHIAVYEGPNIIEEVRGLIGHTEPAYAKPGTIRSMYGGNESLELARQQDRLYINNVVHASDSRSEAEREIAVWKQYLDSFT